MGVIGVRESHFSAVKTVDVPNISKQASKQAKIIRKQKNISKRLLIIAGGSTADQWMESALIGGVRRLVGTWMRRRIPYSRRAYGTTTNLPLKDVSLKVIYLVFTTERCRWAKIPLAVSECRWQCKPTNPQMNTTSHTRMLMSMKTYKYQNA